MRENGYTSEAAPRAAKRSIVMKKSLTTVFAACLLAALLLSCPTAGHAVERIGGNELIDMINAARGRVIVLNFWATWCRPCMEEIPDLIELRKAFPKDELEIIGVSVDENPAQYEAFVDQTPFNYKVRLGARDAMTLFQVSVIPRTIIIDRKGAVAASNGGYVSEKALRSFVEKLLAK